MYKILLITFSLFISASAYSQAGRTYRFFKNERTSIKNPFELRDPFNKKTKKIITEKQKKKRYGTRFSNRPSLRVAETDKLKIIGIFLGKERKALARLVNSVTAEGKVTLSKDVFVLKEGMRIGRNRAEIKAILPGGIVLVEKIRNIYEQEELLETILPLYTPAKDNN